jgi:hypothetical protein
MEDRYLTDQTTFQTSITNTEAAFETSVNNKIAGITGQNFIINGAMDVWQRGTSSTTAAGYGSTDRWYQSSSAVTTTFSRESSIIPTFAQYSLKLVQATNASAVSISQVIETSNAVALAGQNVTLSAYVAASTSTPMTLKVYYSTSVDNGIGGVWTAITATSGGTVTPTSTTYVRGNGVYAIPSTAKSLKVEIAAASLTATASLYVSGVQLEVGTLPTMFNRHAESIAAELISCQRYYYRITPDSVSARYGNGQATSTTSGQFNIDFPVTMRIRPTALEQSGTAAHYQIVNAAGTGVALSAVPTFTQASVKTATITGASTYTAAGNAAQLITANVAGYLGFSAEL